MLRLSVLLFPAMLLAQWQDIPKAPAAQQRLPVPTHNDYVKALKDLAPAKPTKTKAPSISGSISKPVEAPVTVDSELPLSPTAIDALILSNQWLLAENKPTPGKDGRVLYPFGKGLPTIVTAPLEITAIELQPGEHIQPDGVDIGDPRFELTPHEFGSGPSAQTYLVVKPKDTGLETTATIGTDRRQYYLRLVSKPYDHLARVAFTYPDDDADRKLRDYQAKQELEAKQKSDAEELKKADTTGPVKSTDYSVSVGKHAEYLRPASVWDDGAHTYVQLSENARHRGLTNLQLNGPTGPDAPNWRFDERSLTFTIDGLFDRCQLLSGVGRHRLHVLIENRQKFVAGVDRGTR